MISYTEAKVIIEREFAARENEIESIPLHQSVGRVLAADVFADTDLPPFSHSAVDGFAVRYSADRREWNISGEITAGHFIDTVLSADSAFSIMTGAKMPSGADTVIPVEDCSRSGENIILNDSARYRAGMNIRHQGEDMTKGSIAVQKNSTIGSQTISLLAACGAAEVPVYKRLTAGIISTGDELIDVHETPAGDSIRATNLSMLLALAAHHQLVTVNAGIVRDSESNLEEALRTALDDPSIDILVTTGGVSVGTHDYVLSTLKKLGAEILFWKVNIKPGKPLLFAKYSINKRTKLIFGLPGNPLASFVNFTLFISPNIRMVNGVPSSKFIVAELQEPLTKKDGKRHFVCAQTQFDRKKGMYTVRSTGTQSSGNMAALAESNCFVCLPEEEHQFQIGDRVECILV